MRAHQDWGVRSPSVVYNITTQGLSGNPGLSMIYEHTIGQSLIEQWCGTNSVLHLENNCIANHIKNKSVFFVGPHTWSSIAWWWVAFLTALIWIFESWLTVASTILCHPPSRSQEEKKRASCSFRKTRFRERGCVCASEIKNEDEFWMLCC